MDINSFLSQPLTANTYKSKSEDFVKMLIQIVNEIRSGIHFFASVRLLQHFYKCATYCFFILCHITLLYTAPCAASPTLQYQTG